MTSVELRSDIQKILERIENESLLRAIHDFLIVRENAVDGQIWNALTKEQQNEVYLSYQESENDNNLIDWEDVKKKV